LRNCSIVWCLGEAIKDIVEAFTSDDISADVGSKTILDNLKITVAIDANGEGRSLGMLVQSFSRQGIAYLVGRDSDGKIDSIQIPNPFSDFYLCQSIYVWLLFIFYL